MNQLFDKIYSESPVPMLVLLPDTPLFTIKYANKAYLKATNTQESDLLNKGLFEVFPNNPFEINANGEDKLKRSLNKLIQSKQNNKMPIQRYDIPKRGTTDFEEKYWDIENIPILNNTGELEYILHNPNDVTDKIISEQKLSETLYHLNERIKEQRCLYNITKLFSDNIAIEELLFKAAQIIPEGWQYPDNTHVKIEFDNYIFQSPRYTEGEYCIKAERVVIDDKHLHISVYNSSKNIQSLNAAFLEEEYMLINAIADNITAYIKQKNAIDKLKEREEKLSSILSSEPECVKVVSPEGILLEMNPAGLKMIEAFDNPANAIGKNVFGLMHPEDKEIFKNQHLKALNGEDNSASFRIIGLKGTLRYMESNAVPLKNENGEITSVLSVTRDISERILAEEQMHLSEQRFKALVQEGSDLIGILDLQGNYLYVSPTSTSVLGITPEEFIGRNAFEFIHPDDKAAVFSIFSKLETEKRIVIKPFRFTNKNGEWRWIETVVVNMIDNPAVGGIVSNSRDITDKIVAIQQTELSEQRFKALVQEGSDLIAILNNEGIYHYLSPNYLQYLGYKDSELIEKNAFDYIHPNDLIMLKTEFEVLQNEKRLLSSPYRFKHKTDGWRWLRSVGTNLLNDKVINGFVINSVDITDLIAIQENLKTSEERYRGFYESQTNYVIRTDMQGNYSYVNKKFIEEFGWLYPDGEILGKNSLSSICNYHHQQVHEIVLQSIAAPGNVFKVEIDKPQKNGDVLTTLWDFICIVDAHGNPSEIQCMGIDITEQKKHEKAIAQSNERFEKVTQATNDAIWDWDILNDSLYWGEGYQQLFGYKKEEKKPDINTWANRIHKEDKDEVLQNLNETLKDKKQFNWQYEYRYMKADGDYAVVTDKGVIIRNDSGNAIRMVGAMRDITPQKNAELQNAIITEISKSFTSKYEIKDTLYDVLKKVAFFGNFTFGEAWLVDRDRKKINLVSSYSFEVEFKQKKIFESPVKSVKKGQGMPGISWKKKEVVYWENLTEQKKFVRKQFAVENNLKSAFAIPLVNNDESVGVLIMYLDRKAKNKQLFINLFNNVSKHISAEIKRKQIEHELETIFKTAPDIIAIVGFDGYFKKINPIALTLLGYNNEEILEKPFVEFIHPDDRKRIQKEIKQAAENNSTHYIENRFVTKKGESVWLAWSFTPSIEEELIYVVARNITQQKKIEMLFEKASALARIGSWEIDLVANKLYWSDITREIYGVPPDFNPEIDNVASFYRHIETKEKLDAAYNEAVLNGKSWDMELKILSYNNKEKWVRLIGDAQVENGKTIKVYGSIQDIDKIKQAEENTLKTLKEKNQILESISDAFFAIDDTWKINYVNTEAEKLLLQGKSKVVGKKLWDVFENTIDTPFYTYLHRSMNEKTIQHFEMHYAILDKWFDASVYPSDQGLSIYLRDVTERKNSELKLFELNKELLQHSKELSISNQELEQFAYVASHDLQEPLRMVTSFLTQLEKKYGEAIDDKGKMYINYAVDGAKRMRQIILDLLEYSRVGRDNSNKEKIDVTELLNEIKALQKKQIEEKKAEIHFLNLPVIISYLSPVRQIFMNLIGNALKYSKANESPIIHVLCEEKEKFWQFSVSDNGIGIEQEYFDKIFIIFQRLHAKNEYSGSGIGLAITKKIIENLGGKIWLESTIGKGSTFYFTLPKNRYS